MAERILNTHTEWVDPKNTLTPEEIVDLCCEEVDVDPCSEYGRVTPWAGEPSAPPDNLPPDPGRQSVIVELVGPSGNCGQMHEAWSERNDCCDNVSPLQWDYNNSAAVISPGSSGLVRVTGGKPPYIWRIRGDGFYGPGGLRDLITDSPTLYIELAEWACGSGPVYVSDGCSETKGGIRSTDGKWFFDGVECGAPGADYPFINTVEEYRGEFKYIYHFNGDQGAGSPPCSGTLPCTVCSYSSCYDDDACEITYITRYKWGCV